MKALPRKTQLWFLLPWLLQLWRRTLKKAANETPMVEVLEKTVVDAKIKRRKKDTYPAAVSLEAHQATSSLNDVSIVFVLAS
jgi:hypothetical protein